MHRSRRLSRAVLLAGGGILAAIGVALATPGYAAAPTVSFTGSGGLSCSTQAAVSSLILDQGNQLIVVNDSPNVGKVEVDGVQGPALPGGHATQLTLTPGQHVVTLRPVCTVVTDVGSVVVTVAAPPTSEAPAPSEPGTPSEPRPPGPVPPTPPDGATVSPGSPLGVGQPAAPPGGGAATGGGNPSTGEGTATAATGDGTTARTGEGTAQSLVPVADGSATRAVFVGETAPEEFGYTYPLHDLNSPYGRNLLAIIAVICILGVSVGIIRAILAERPGGRAKM